MSRYIDADALKEFIDCGHLRNPCEVCFSELDVVNLIDAQPTVDAEPRWIPVSERLPKMKEIVLITNDKGHVRCGQYRGVGFFSKNDGRPHWNWKGNTLETVVAWMPLPKPYEVEE
jgi:hypothetical protein